MREWDWRVSDDRKWTEVFNADDELVAMFNDDDLAAEYVEWQNHHAERAAGGEQ